MVFAMFCLSSESFGQQGSVINTSFYSKSMLENRNMLIYLPDGYDQQDTATRYPVIYWLHGGGDDSYSEQEIFQSMLDGLTNSGSILPTIVVKPDGKRKDSPFAGDDSWYTNSELFGNIEDFIVKDLVEFIDSSFNTFASREKRSICGFSMGALGAMRFALKHPEVYCGVVANSGYPDMSKLSLFIPSLLSEYKGIPISSFKPEAGSMSDLFFVLSGAYSPNLSNPPYFVDFPLDSSGNWIDSVWARWNLNNCAFLAKNLTDTSDLALFFDCGKQDETLAYDFNTSFADTLNKLGLYHVFQSFSGTHLSQVLNRIRFGYQFLDSIMNKSNGVYNVFALKPVINKHYVKINADSALFLTGFSNKFNHTFTPHLIVANSDNTLIDSLLLYDDGLHGDSLANDGLYGAYVLPRQTEDFFSLSVSTKDNQTNKYYITPVQCRYTTAGPVVLDSISYRKGSSAYQLKLYLKNESDNTSIKKPSVKIICNDPWVLPITYDTRGLYEILPEQIESTGTAILLTYIDSIFPGYFNFKFEISSDGYVYWTDTLRLKTVVTVTKPELQETTFNLGQNYPNPFNSKTTIKYSVPESSKVILRIYNVLGKEIETIVSEEKPTGSYEVTWNAGNLPGGVYFYQFNAGGLIETRKMILRR
jgi:S-formylglutathione hydrolase FrmB